MTDEHTPEFDSIEAAYDWMADAVDDPCIDNHRFAFLDDAAAVEYYKTLESKGCCGYFDCVILVEKRKATIGCNYGH